MLNSPREALTWQLLASVFMARQAHLVDRGRAWTLPLFWAWEAAASAFRTSQRADQTPRPISTAAAFFSLR